MYAATLDWYAGFVYCVADLECLFLLALSIYVFWYLERHKKRMEAVGAGAEEVEQVDEQSSYGKKEDENVEKVQH